MKTIIFTILLSTPLLLNSQHTLTLDECFDGVAINYPLAKQAILLAEKNQLEVDLINKNKMPQLNLNAQATYQSDVTMLPIEIPNMIVESPNKDQYKAVLDVSQMIYNGGLIDASVKIKQANLASDQQALDVKLYGLKEQVSMLYMSILLLDENSALLQAKEKQLATKIDALNASVEHGISLPSSVNALTVEILKIKQQLIELNFNKTSLRQRLSQLIGKEVPLETEFIIPSVSPINELAMNRPELILFDLKKKQIDYSSELLTKSRQPKINGFAQGGYGNPGLNMLDNSFTPFFMVGLRLNWVVFDWFCNKPQEYS